MQPSEEAEPAHYDDVLSVKLAYVEALRRESEPSEESRAEAAEAHALSRHYGLGLGYEHALVPGWVNAQASSLLFFGAEGIEVPSSLTLELPYELTESTEVYLGAGLAADLVRDGDWSPSFGLASAAGLYAWASQRLGANLELEHRWIPNEHRVYDLTVSVAAAARF